MPEFLSPGVFVEEVDAGPKPIEGVSTSTAGAVGVTTFGPTSGKPVLVTSFAEFVRIFGPPIPEPTDPLISKLAHEDEGGRWWQFALSIKGFFDNGGQRIFVKRVFSKNGAKAAEVDFGQGLVSEIEADAAAGATSLKLEHLIGISRDKEVTVFDPASVGTFRVLAYNAVERTILLDGALPKAVQAGSFVQILRPSPQKVTFTARAKALGSWGNDLRAQVRPMVGATASLLADLSTSGASFKTEALSSELTWVIRVDDTTGLDHSPKQVEIKGTTYDFEHFDPDTNTFEVKGTPPKDVLTLGEAQGREKLQIRTRNGFKAKVATTLPAPGGEVLKLDDVTKLVVDDLILVGADPKERKVVRVDANKKEVTVDPGFTGEVGANTEVKKITTNVLSGGTRTRNTLRNVVGLEEGDFIFFVPTGRRFKIVEDPVGNTIKIAPAIPLGFDWIGRPIEKIAPEIVAQVETDLTAPGDSVALNDISDLAVGDVVEIGNRRREILAKVAGSPAPAGTIRVTPGFETGNLPVANTPVRKALAPVLVTATAADWTLTVESGSGIQERDHVLVNGREITVTKKADKVLSFSFDLDKGDPWKKGSVVRLLRVAGTPGSKVINVSGASRLYKGAIVELDNSVEKDVRTIESIDGDKVTLFKAPDHTYREGHKLRVVEAQVQARQVVDNRVVQEESFSNLRLVNDKSSFFFMTAVKNASALIEIAEPLGEGFPDTPSELADLASFPTSADGGFAPLAKGEDGLDQLTVDDFVGEDGGTGNRTGIQALEDIDEVSICLAPNMWSPTIHSGLLLHCETLKDRFAILDPKDGLSIEQIRDVREGLDSKYGALYYPWLEVRNPFISQNVQVAPSGHMAGIYARVDVERGVHKAPANEIIRGITKIADEVTKREQDLLNPKGINALRFFPGRGNRVWGARTISSDSSWKYINVRRLFLFVEESIDEGTQFVVFEPNAEPTWARVRQTITNFLTTVWRGGALEGTTADQAFFVKCDRTTMSQDDIDNGRLICVIGIAPVKPAEFVIFRIQQLVRTSNPT